MSKTPVRKSVRAAVVAPAPIAMLTNVNTNKSYPVTTIASFARRFKCDASALGRVIRGERSSHKNWVLAA